MKIISSYRLKHAFLLIIAAIIFLFFTTCKSDKPKSGQTLTELNFAFGPDDGGTIQPLIDKFNETQKGKIKVKWNVTSRYSDEFYKQIEANYTSADSKMDVIGADVVWAPSFASKGYVTDISTKFFKDFNPSDFLIPALNSTSYQLKIWGVPWFTDAGILFYRSDILSELGYKVPPSTWKELTAISKQAMNKKKIKYGFVFQGANYEGGTANACEYIWNAGGSVLIGDLSMSGTPDENQENEDIIVINSKEAKNGLSVAQELVKSGIVPSSITDMRELEAGKIFQDGDALFMRAWPTIFGIFQNNDSKVKQDQIGLAPLPTNDKNKIGRSCLGGWNLMIDSRVTEAKKAAAWEFIKFLTSEESQKYRAVKGGVLPTLNHLYEDEILKDQVPAMEIALQVIPRAKERPRTPNYMDMSPLISGSFYKLLKMETTPEDAVKNLDRLLTSVLVKK